MKLLSLLLTISLIPMLAFSQSSSRTNSNIEISQQWANQIYDAAKLTGDRLVSLQFYYMENDGIAMQRFYFEPNSSYRIVARSIQEVNGLDVRLVIDGRKEALDLGFTNSFRAIFPLYKSASAEQGSIQVSAFKDNILITNIPICIAILKAK